MKDKAKRDRNRIRWLEEHNQRLTEENFALAAACRHFIDLARSSGADVGSFENTEVFDKCGYTGHFLSNYCS